ncbi:MAG: molybdenum cofactor guanylyltransferase [Deltaproteobacteria bacterium]|nr:MAG: molybdenum cofactor guanylyltransferase [Deltaproteobacteria bacterium]
MRDVSKVSDKTPDPVPPGVTGVILAGGKSSRYGRNKAFVKIGGVCLIDRVVRVMRAVFRNIILITNTPDEYAYLGLPMHADLIHGLGPIGGVYTGLSVIADEAAFFVACDMPFLKPELIRYILDCRAGFDVVVPRISGMVEALHALYSRKCLDVVRKLIDAGQYQTLRVFDQVPVRYVEEEEIRRFDPDLGSFININRPRDVRRLGDR